jgi:hypothetical protein
MAADGNGRGKLKDRRGRPRKQKGRREAGLSVAE